MTKKSTGDSRFAESLKRTSGAAWQGLELRLELLSTELHEEKQEVLVLGVLAQLAMFCVFMAFLCLNVLVFVIFWDTHRVVTAVTLSAIYLVAAVAAGLYVRRRARSAAHPFSATLEELRKDRQAMTSNDP
jgi:uncharacterized membrane protein YqjE